MTNVIQQRNGYVLEVQRARPRASRTLDVGCGTGELAIDQARLGAQAEGVDFAPEMIELAEQKARELGIENVAFKSVSIFDYAPDEKFDLISANGFIEYISENDLRRFVKLAHNWLNPGGALVLGSRNRLFNLCSFNEFTTLEREMGCYDELLKEAMLLAQGSSFDQIVRSPLPKPESHPNTGIDVHKRLQYTPGELAGILHEASFKVIGLAGIHYHAAPPSFARMQPETHVLISEAMYRGFSNAQQLIPNSSSFMIAATSE